MHFSNHVWRVWTLAALLALGGCAPQTGNNRLATTIAGDNESATIELTANADGALAIAIAGLFDDELDRARLDPSQAMPAVQVRVATAPADLPAMAGQLAVKDGRLLFTPRYPFTPGVRYRVDFQRFALGHEGTTSQATEIEVPKPVTEPTTITGVYPTADRLPENQLKFYLHFSQPMSRGEAYRRVHLLDADGKEVEASFLELGEELWDLKQERFTLLFDPGRVKRGLVPREEEGPILIEGRDFTFVIDAGWLDASGLPLASGAKKQFHVLPPREAPIDIAAWKIDPPKAGTRDPLVVSFATPMDHAMLGGCLSVRAAGQTVASETTPAPSSAFDGRGVIGPEERSWSFVPAEPWRDGSYLLSVDTALEDISGNTIRHAFDVDVFGPIQKQITTETVELPFVVGR